MGTQLLRPLISPSFPLINPNNDNKFPTSIRCGTTRSRPAGGLNWDSNAEQIPAGRFRFNIKDEFDGDDDGDDFEFSGTAKRRIWWSNDDDFEEIDEDDEFFVFKVLRAFGWMLPAIAISLLLGTGPNAFLMALAIPLGQSALSLAIDKFWGSTSSGTKSRPRTKTKKKPFARAATAASNVKTSERKQENKTGEERGSYQSWVAADGGSYAKGGKTVRRFGGWDELDKQVGTGKDPKRAPSQMANRLPKQWKKDKLSRMGRVRDKPLLVRILIAIFPILGSWTKLLF